MEDKISIIIPAYNEEKTIGGILQKVINQVRNWNSEIIVVNDGSKDHTLDKVRVFLDKIKLVDLKENHGKGRAVREGLKKATGDIVIIQDADLELDPSDYPKLINPILEKKAEVVYGSRLLEKTPSKSLIFFWGGKFMTFLANLLYGLHITDQTNGYKIMRRELMESLRLESDGFEICSEITAKIAKRGIKIYEVPVLYYPRKSNEGKKLKVWHGFKAAFAFLKYKFRE